MKKWCFPLLFLPALVSCNFREYKILPDGVVVHVKSPQEGGPSRVRIKAVSECVVRVSAVPGRTFNDRKSLIVSTVEPQEPGTHHVAFKVLSDEHSVYLHTNGLHVQVDKESGRVLFADMADNLITAETAPVRMTPITVEGTHGYTTENRFMTTVNEGLYGLGQHQSDEWNYRGASEELYQYNTKISIPFVISSKNYGIFWDSYSLGRFGRKDPYSQLNEVFNIYDKNGDQGSLTGTYLYDSQSPFRLMAPLVRSEDSLYFVDSETVKNLPRLGSTVLYEGSLEPKESGVYDFLLYYSGYIKLYLGGKEVVKERWRTAWNPNSHKFSLEMKRGQHYSLRIEWRPDGSTAYCGLRACSPLPQQEKNQLSMWNEMVPQSDYYFMAADNMDGVIGRLRELTGRTRMLPKWAFGFWQSRERYTTQEELISVVDSFRSKGIGLDNVVQDWNYWPEDAWGSHEFDRERYPNPDVMVKEIHKRNAHLMISVWPKFYVGTDHFKELADEGHIYMQAVEDSIKDWVGPGYVGSFYDAYSERGRQIFWNQLRHHLYSLDIDAWWMDATEPNIRDCVPMDYWKALCTPTELGSSTEYLTAYSLMNAKAIYEGLQVEDSNKRVFQLTRSGTAGLQRYATASWSGDIGSRWEDMYSQITAGLNYSLCGNPYWTMDVGGFCVEQRYVQAQRLYDMTGVENADLKEWRELQARWHQFGAFTPLYRAHGQFPYREPWNIAPENHVAYKSITYYNDLRYRLMPYIYSVAAMTHYRNYTMMRGLVMDFGSDPIAMRISDQYMFGPALMICPVYKYGVLARRVYLPAGRVWYDFYQPSDVYVGNTTVYAYAPCERIPIFVPSGSIIPFGPGQQYVDQVQTDTLDVHIYAGDNGRLGLYEDDGVSYNCERGEFSVIPIIYNDELGEVTLRERRGRGYPGMLRERVFNFTLHAISGEEQTRSVRYDGNYLTVNF